MMPSRHHGAVLLAGSACAPGRDARTDQRHPVRIITYGVSVGATAPCDARNECRCRCRAAAGAPQVLSEESEADSGVFEHVHLRRQFLFVRQSLRSVELRPYPGHLAEKRLAPGTHEVLVGGFANPATTSVTPVCT